MTLSRRRLLQAVGVAAGTLGISASAAGSTVERVFVHPSNGLIGDLLDAIELVGGETLFVYDNFDFVVAAIPEKRIDDLLAASGVASVEEDDEFGIPDGWSPSILEWLLPPDRSDCSTHPAQRTSWGHERIGADEVDPNGAGVDVGILDTGIQTDHCSVSVAGGRNFTLGSPTDYEDRHGHGTHVAGVAGALDNDLGVIGVAPGANLYGVKVLDDDGEGRYSELVAGIDWCISNDVEVISMSLGGEDASAAVDEAIETAHEAGHLLLAAAGNEGNNGDGSCDEETMTYPATHESVVAVAAMNEDDALASFSSVGSAVDLLAPGTNVASTTVGNRYAEANGTSVACPFVTGVAALLWETGEWDGPGPNEAVRDVLTSTAETVLDTCEEGHGLVDARAALDDGSASEGEESGTNGSGANGARSVLERALNLLVRVLEGLVALVRTLLEWLVGLFR